MKNLYLVVDSEHDGKWCAEVLAVRENRNLLPVLPARKNAKIVRPCQTKREAEQLAEFWNQCHKNNNEYDILASM